MSTKKLFIFTLILFISLVTISCKKKSDSPEVTPDTTGTIVPATTLTDVLYGANLDRYGVNENLYLDLYFPIRKSGKKYPLAMMIHGGAYVSGDKSDMKGNCQILADSGFVVASINYRMGWDNGVADCDGDTVTLNQAGYRALQDANAALRFLIAHASQYFIDTNWVFVGGNSAGSSISLNTSYVTETIANKYFHEEHQLLGPVNNADNQYTNSFTIKGICNMWGALPDSNLITNKTAKPTISYHGTNDGVVPYNIGSFGTCPNYPMLYGSTCIHRQLVKYNQPVISNFVIGGGHGPDVYTHAFLMSNTACFWKRIINGIPIKSRVDTQLISSCN
jgi:hypothetical protein